MKSPLVPPSKPDRYALLGWPLRNSVSPAMHDAAFRALGMSARYELRRTPPDALGRAVDEIRSGTLAGANVTIPHKVAVRAWLDEESGAAARIGAVNTVVRTDRGLRGENTDLPGFVRALESVGLGPGGTGIGHEPERRPTSPATDTRGNELHPAGAGANAETVPGSPEAVVLGAGGAARAVVDVLLGAGWAVTILSRSVSAGALLLRRMGPHYPSAITACAPLDAAELVRRGTDAALLVNATPVGDARSPNDCLWPEGEPIPDKLAVIDLVAWPPRTRLVDRAQASGAPAVGGLPMLVGQAEASFELWVGQAPPPGVMVEAAQQTTGEAIQEEPT